MKGKTLSGILESAETVRQAQVKAHFEGLLLFLPGLVLVSSRLNHLLLMLSNVPSVYTCSFARF